MNQKKIEILFETLLNVLILLIYIVYKTIYRKSLKILENELYCY